MDIEKIHEIRVNDGRNLKFKGGISCATCHCELSVESAYILSESMYSGVETSDIADFQDCTPSILFCRNCQICCAVAICNSWISIEKLLVCNNKTSTNAVTIDTFQVVTKFWQRLVLWVLNTVIFKQETISKDVTCMSIPPNEFAKLLCHGSEVVGFYTAKLKGSPYSHHSPQCYHLPVIDLIYVRKPFRGQGLGGAIVEDAVKTFPGQDLGFSTPISEPMYIVLRRYLQDHAVHRDRLWEVDWIGCEGYRRNVWFTLCKNASKSNREQ